ncbi:hypothetical protein PSN45_003860 [Yamadazyma tenuis]|uniref:uncharacterized protein n=1 Tax=Candida tenuis TaxID=2315449 RepID=UPI0027A2E9BB|nr:hypothetical protein PSN45_003860 [Yamadazyma tenuis]
MTLQQQLEDVLPKGHTFRVLHVQSEPKQCTNLIKYGSEHSAASKPQLTIKIKHFLLVISSDNLVLFGIEVYNYFTVAEINTQYLFVSKVDTTGLTDLKINANKLINRFLQSLISINHTSLTYRVKSPKSSTIKKINKLLSPSKPSYRTVQLSDKFITKVSLFTKSSNQYFFPESSKNLHKHLIDGDKLLRWWLQLIDDTLADSQVKFTKKLMIPGSHSPHPYLLSGWELGSVFGENQRAVYNIPSFPDDPKTRFLEFLVVENRVKLKLPEFYEELGFRQEFRLGNVVGIIGCESEVMSSSPDMGARYEPVVLSNKQYKQLIKVIKSEDFSICDDVRLLVNTKLPFFLRLHHKSFEYSYLCGKYEHSKVSKSTVVQVNNLSGLVRKKKK